MDQQELIKDVLLGLETTPEIPPQGRYLSLAQAESILDETIEHVRNTGSTAEYEYLTGHRRRLSISLSMIPFAESPSASCLDIGCYGYMAFWAWHHLGYSRVEGIEMRPDLNDALSVRNIEIGGKSLALKVHNFNITKSEWPIQGTFDTVLFFETLEHVDQDPSGVLLNVTRRMHSDSALVISVPNAISYKVLREFMTGAPPWVYWFFHPDLSHEPRHSFEYTPIFFKMVLRSAGLFETAFRTICAFADPDSVADIYKIGEALSIKPSWFGDTIVAVVRKKSDEPLARFPDCLYSGERYYRTTYPVLHERLTHALNTYSEQHEATFRDAYARGEAMNRQAFAQTEEEYKKALENEKEGVRVAIAQLAEAVAARDAAQTQMVEALAQCQQTLFLCDNYLEQVRSDQAEKTALLDQIRIEQAEKSELQAQVKAAQARTAHVTADFEAVTRSTFWRATAPARRFGTRHPRITVRVRAVLAHMARAFRLRV